MHNHGGRILCIFVVEEKCDVINNVNLIQRQFNFLCSVRFFGIIVVEKWCDFYFGLQDECFYFLFFCRPYSQPSLNYFILFIYFYYLFILCYFIYLFIFFQISKSSVVDDIVDSNKILYGSNEKPDHCVVIKYVPYVGKLALMVSMLVCSLEIEKSEKIKVQDHKIKFKWQTKCAPILCFL